MTTHGSGTNGSGTSGNGTSVAGTSAPRRGAPDRNRNALKHGLYSRYNHPASSAQPGTQNPTLEDEIGVLRGLLPGIVDLYYTAPDPQQAFEILRHICLVLTTLNRLTRTQSFIIPPEDPRWAALEQAARDVTSTWPLIASLNPNPTPTPD
jgi:hypothetical protein